jgi:DNA gyrase/topoisomerase IV subunit B
MSNEYNAAAIEVLTGLDPVRKRPGMYTDTTRPNHLVQEVVDNSVDEALAGYADSIDVVLHKDGSVTVKDNGRGMPVDIHPEQGMPGVEVILTQLHSGGKFSNKNYQFSGGLHGVGVSVVNALSEKLEIEVKRGGGVYQMSFANGDKVTDLQQTSTVGKNNTGTSVHFWPDGKYFDSNRVSVSKLKHVLRAKAVLCPGLKISLLSEAPEEQYEWCYQNGLQEYLLDRVGDVEIFPQQPFIANMAASHEAVEWGIVWTADSLPETINESYVNLVPTAQGGTHVNGLRAGLTEAIREFCDFRNLLPRGVKIAPEDVWENCHFVLSVKLEDPQFSGQTKERLSSRECVAFVSGVAKDGFSLWLNQHPQEGEKIAEIILTSAQKRLKSRQKNHPQTYNQRPCPARQAGGLLGTGHHPHRTVSGGRRFRRRLGETSPRPGVSGHHALTRQDSEYLGSGFLGGNGLPRSPRYRRGAGHRTGQQGSAKSALRQNLHPGRCRLRRQPHCHLDLRFVFPAFCHIGTSRPCLCRHAAAVSHRCRQTSVLCAGRIGKTRRVGQDRSRKTQRQNQCATL